MDGVLVSHVSKRFGDWLALNDVSFQVKKGELVTLLGPSGCGKTTMLRCIAGLERPDKGEVEIDGRRITSIGQGTTDVFVPPQNRGVGLVFQSYAIWPHLTIFKNVAYGLEVMKTPKDDISKKVSGVLSMLGLNDLSLRYPSELSGGQQQRVALARSLVTEPNVLLLDEPLSNLDAKLREEARVWLIDLQKRLGITVIHVTHDQAEAMAISDRIVIMNKGSIVQIGKPSEIYRNPANTFVSNFIGRSNFIRATVKETMTSSDSNERCVAVEVQDAGKTASRNNILNCYADFSIEPGQEVVVSVRPENVRLHMSKPVAEMPNVFGARIEKRIDMGRNYFYYLKFGDAEFSAESADDIPVGAAAFVELPPKNCRALKE